MNDAVGPLAGIVVADFTRFFAGPLASSWLGDMGADVIKIEDPGTGDPIRGTDGQLANGSSSYFAGLNRSKRSIELDLRLERHLAIARSIVEKADVLIENFRPGVMDRLGLGYDPLHEQNPKLVYCSISSFGETGPLVHKPGMDIVVQAMGGVMGLTGREGDSPSRVGAPVADYVGALQAMVAIGTALVERARSGVGQKVSLSLLEGQMGMLSNYLPGFFITGNPSGPVGNYHPQLVPYQPYETSDGEVIVACLTEEFWRRLCRVLDLERLIDDPRFLTIPDRVAHRDALNEILIPVFKGMTSDALTQRLEAADVPCAPILTLARLVSHPQVEAMGSVVTVDHPDGFSYRVVAPPFRFSRTPVAVRRPVPSLGEHTEEILAEFATRVAGDA